jgi:hypothetical protein
MPLKGGQMNSADFEIKYVDAELIFIIDLDLGNKSVTNDVENVLKKIDGIIGLHCRRLFYKDTMNRIDEIRHEMGRFVCFKPIDSNDPLLKKIHP